MQKQKRPVGRPPAKNKKTKWLKIRVTPEMDAMFKDAPKSDLINKGLSILMPTLGSKWNGEKWEQYKLHGMEANAVAYRGKNVAIEMLMDSWELDQSLFTPSESSLLKLLRKQKEELEQHQTFHIQKETP